MLSKEETVKKLIENGIDAELKDNVVYVHGANHKKVARILKELQLRWMWIKRKRINRSSLNNLRHCCIRCNCNEKE